MNSLQLTRKLIGSLNLDGYIVPKNDEYFGEYSFPNRLKTISNFSGSAGLAIILQKKNYLFVDGRYTLQSHQESGKNFSIFEIPQKNINEILKRNNNLVLGYDARLFTKSFLQRNFPSNCNLIPIRENIIDLSTKKLHQKNIKFYSIENKKISDLSKNKIKKVLKFMKNRKIDNIFISAPENVAWLLNIRGHDSPNSPIPNCKIILTKKNKIYFFSSKHKIQLLKKNRYLKKIKYYTDNEFYKILLNLKGTNFSIDSNTCSIFFEDLINSRFKITNRVDPCYNLKSIKNNNEIKETIKAHEADGVALTKFLYWMKNTSNIKINEIGAINKLNNLRKRNKNYLYPSFNTIAGSGPNGAIIHYNAKKSTTRKIRKNDIFLCDSGGQYIFGTTDVTRTICFEKPPKRIMDIFTMVLKGHISVATFTSKKKVKGSELDKKARTWLNKRNLDYPHGTGHGVGFFLNVHEGPCSFSKNNNSNIKEGMILSNEPGYYQKNKFGIRIENLIYVVKKNGLISFKNLTLAPIDKDLINFNLLNKNEKNYLKSYNQNIYDKIGKYLNLKEKKWLENLF